MLGLSAILGVLPLQSLTMNAEMRIFIAVECSYVYMVNLQLQLWKAAFHIEKFLILIFLILFLILIFNFFNFNFLNFIFNF
jgi:hypothetical protein